MINLEQVGAGNNWVLKKSEKKTKAAENPEKKQKSRKNPSTIKTRRKRDENTAPHEALGDLDVQHPRVDEGAQRAVRKSGRGRVHDKRERRARLTTRPVAAGTELTISYIDENLPRTARRTELNETYSFNCQCDRCVDEEASLYTAQKIRPVACARIPQARSLRLAD